MDALNFFYLSFLLLDIHKSQDIRGKCRPFVLPLYHLYLLHEHLDINWAITTKSLLVRIGDDSSNPKTLFSDHKLLVIKVNKSVYISLIGAAA